MYKHVCWTSLVTAIAQLKHSYNNKKFIYLIIAVLETKPHSN